MVLTEENSSSRFEGIVMETKSLILILKTFYNNFLQILVKKCSFDATDYGNLERKELKLASGQSRFLCGANSLLLQKEYFSSQPVVLKAYSGNDRFHDYIHHMHRKSVV